MIHIHIYISLLPYSVILVYITIQCLSMRVDTSQVDVALHTSLYTEYTGHTRCSSNEVL